MIFIIIIIIIITFISTLIFYKLTQIIVKYLDFGSFKRYNKEIKIGSAISCEDGSNTTSNKVVKPFTVATTRGFSTLNSRNVSIQIRRKLSSL